MEAEPRYVVARAGAARYRGCTGSREVSRLYRELFGIKIFEEIG